MQSYYCVILLNEWFIECEIWFNIWCNATNRFCQVLPIFYLFFVATIQNLNHRWKQKKNNANFWQIDVSMVLTTGRLGSEMIVFYITNSLHDVHKLFQNSIYQHLLHVVQHSQLVLRTKKKCFSSIYRYFHFDHENKLIV